MATKQKSGMQWKTLNALSVDDIASTCEEWTGKGWTVFAILLRPENGIIIVLNRMLVL